MKKLFFGGDIITMEGGDSPEAVLVSGGKISAVGSKADLMICAPDAEPCDLCGRTLAPAFIDAHSHFSGVASSFFQVQLGGAASFEDITEAIKAYIAQNKTEPGEWITGIGYDHTALKEKKHPDKLILDAAAPHNPVVISHVSGHNGVFNSMALKKLGMTADSPAPDGGRIEIRDGELTGFMEENAYTSAVMKIPSPDADRLMRGFDMAQKKYATYGITTVQEGMIPPQMLPFLGAIIKNEALYIDLIGYAAIADADKIMSALPGCIKKYQNGFKLAGYKIFLDGSPQAKTAWLRAPYNNSGDYKGYPTMSDAAVCAAAEKSARDEMQLLAHCNGDAAAAQFISAVARAQREYKNLKELRPVMIHAQLLARDQLEEVSRLKIIPSFFVAHVYRFGDVHIKNFGIERAKNISPAGSALKKGMVFTFHQDSPVLEPDMLHTIWCAAERRTKSGVLLGEDQRISVYEAMKAVTVNAAYQYGELAEKGTVSPGKKADFVILSENPLRAETEGIPDIKITETIKNGKTIYKME